MLQCPFLFRTCWWVSLSLNSLYLDVSYIDEQYIQYTRVQQKFKQLDKLLCTPTKMRKMHFLWKKFKLKVSIFEGAVKKMVVFYMSFVKSDILVQSEQEKSGLGRRHNLWLLIDTETEHCHRPVSLNKGLKELQYYFLCHNIKYTISLMSSSWSTDFLVLTVS